MTFSGRSSLAVFILFGGILHAASFDCGKARTRTEKFICSDAAFSTADERMAEAYTKAVGLASSITPEEAKELKGDQRVCPSN